MLNHKELSLLRKQLDADDAQREEIIAIGREVIRASKTVIYALQRSQHASKELKELDVLFKKLRIKAKNTPRLLYQGSFKAAAMEYAEARIFAAVCKNQPIPSASILGLEPEHYLLGLCDVSGELVRKTINAALNDDTTTAKRLAAAVSSIYDELMLFDFGNGELRKKFDGLKYDVQKVENVLLELKR